MLFFCIKNLKNIVLTLGLKPKVKNNISLKFIRSKMILNGLRMLVRGQHFFQKLLFCSQRKIVFSSAFLTISNSFQIQV